VFGGDGGLAALFDGLEWPVFHVFLGIAVILQRPVSHFAPKIVFSRLEWKVFFALLQTLGSGIKESSGVSTNTLTVIPCW